MDDVWSVCVRHPGVTWTTSGGRLNDIWNSSGRQVGVVWSTSVGRLDAIWKSCGLHLEVVWTTSGRHLEYMWRSFILHLEVFERHPEVSLTTSGDGLADMICYKHNGGRHYVQINKGKLKF